MGASYPAWLAQAAGPKPFGSVVCRHGAVVSEHYGGGASADSVWEIGSLRKSVGAALLGIQVGARRVRLDQPASDILPELLTSDEDRRIEVAQLFTSTSGWKTAAAAGVEWKYNNAAFTLGGMVVGRLLGTAGDEIAQPAQQMLADALGCSSWRAYHFPGAFSESHGNPGPKLAIDSNLRDLCTYGQLWLQRGQWREQTLIPRELATLATRNQVLHLGHHYGYCWFTNDHRRLLPDVPEDAFFHIGNGRQNRRTVLAVVPSLDLVAAAGTDADSYDLSEGYADAHLPRVSEWLRRVIAELPGDRITVGQWNRFETSVVNPNPYNDPYRDVDLNVTYRRPDQSTVDFWGFYDGGDTWRLRFLVEQLGDWSFESAFSDGTPGPRGEFTCVPSSTPGLIHRDEQVPSWFGFKGGAHLQLRCLHVGDRFFAANWDDPRDLTDGCGRSLFLNWLQAQRYNALSIASHYLNRDVEDRGRGWETPALWPPNAGEYQKAELILDELADREICVFPFAGFFGQSAAFPSDPADQELYLRYTLARFGAYWNLLLNVAGPEPDVHPEKFGDQMKHDDVDRLGQAIKRLDVPGHLLSIHQGGGTDRYAEAAWRDYVTLQGWKGKEWDEIYQGMIDNRAAHKPLFAQEVLWPGNVYNKPFTEAEIRRKAFLLTMAAASINYGDMDGKSSTGFSGSMNLDDRHQPWHDLIHEVWDFFAESGVHRYRPAPELVVGGYCLAEPGGGCLVLVLDAGEVAVDLSATAAPLTARWFECGRRVYSDGFRVEGGETVRFVPPTSEDAVLIIEVAEAGLSA